MFLNKVHDQKVELLRAVFRNMYLKEKCDYLDGECKMLADHILSSQVTKAEQSELKTTLENELDKLRQLHDQQLDEFTLAQEHLASISMVLEKSHSHVSENKSIDEELGIKNDMIKCLQEELVCVRLQVAEQWAFIRELRQMREELQNDKEMLTKTKPETISRLQEKLMEAKFIEAQFALELDKIKKHVQELKAEVELHLKNHYGEDSASYIEGNVKVTKKGVLWKISDNKVEKGEILEDIQKLENEKSYLQSRIPDLHSKLKILNNHIEYKEQEKGRLQEKLNNFRLKQQSLENITIERIRQYDHLEDSASEKVYAIRNSSNEKKQNIDELSEKLQDIETSERRESITGSITIKETQVIQTLEQQIVILKNKISELESETMICSSNGHHSETVPNNN